MFCGEGWWPGPEREQVGEAWPALGRGGVVRPARGGWDGRSGETGWGGHVCC